MPQKLDTFSTRQGKEACSDSEDSPRRKSKDRERERGKCQLLLLSCRSHLTGGCEGFGGGGYMVLSPPSPFLSFSVLGSPARNDIISFLRAFVFIWMVRHYICFKTTPHGLCYPCPPHKAPSQYISMSKVICISLFDQQKNNN